MICVFGLVVSHFLHMAFVWLRTRFAGWRLVLGAALGVIATAAAGALLARPGMAPLFARFFPGEKPLDPPQFFGLYNEFQFMLTAWTASYFAVINYRNFRVGREEQLRLTNALKEAELRALRTQINPHFLFNSLNLLRALIPRELTQPREAVTLLADVLRASLTVGEQETIPLARELATVDNYLAIEQLRYGSRLRVARRIDPAASDRPIPPFLVQGLVENAVKFGIAPREEGGEIGLTAEVRPGGLFLAVTNPGRIANGSDSTGLGLRNARRRLEFLFGSSAVLSLAQREADLVAAEVFIPLPPAGVPAPRTGADGR
jgi:LytS/YehU family sensor histidine kinase